MVLVGYQHCRHRRPDFLAYFFKKKVKGVVNNQIFI